MGDDILDALGRGQLSPGELKMIQENIDLDSSARGTGGARIGLGEDLERARDTILTGPRPTELRGRLRMPPEKPKPLERMKPKAKAIAETQIPLVRAIPVVPNHCLISNFQISNDRMYRVDMGIYGRTDILVANMSLGTIWVNSMNVGTTVGVPLKAMSAAAAYDGGVMRLSIDERTRYWAIGSVVGPLLVVTVELGLRG